jgi:hypothetical protein
LAPTSRYWPAYWRARRRLGRAATATLDEELTAWMIGLVQAEIAGRARSHPGASGKLERLALPDFELLVRVRLDKGGTVEHIDFFDVRRK